MKSWCQGMDGDVPARGQCCGRWINMNVDDAGTRIRMAPFAKPATGRHEGEGLSQILARGVGQTLDGSEAPAPRQVLVRDQQMQGTAVCAGETLAPGNGYRLHHHARTEPTTSSEPRRPHEIDAVVCAALDRVVHYASSGAPGDGIAGAPPLTAKGDVRGQVHGRRRREERCRTKSAAGDARRAKLPGVAGSGGRRRCRPWT